MSSYLTAKQVEQLLKEINPKRVNVRDGMSYVEAHDVKAHLDRIFGFARWSWSIVSSEVVHKEQTTTKAGKPAWYVVAQTVGVLTVCAPDGTVLASYGGSHAGDNTHPVLGECIGNALTNSDSYALKRAATMLGDQFGLSLYNKGQRAAIVGRTLVGSEQGDVDAAVPQITPEAPEHADPEPRPVETNRPKPPAPAPQPPAPPKRDSGKAQDLADQALAVQGSAKDRMVALTKLELAAITAGVKDQQVTRADGKQIPLYELIKECIAHSRIGRAS